MADIVTGTVTGQLDTSDLVRDHADIRREQESIGSNIRREAAADACKTVDAVKTSAWHNSDRTGTEADRVTNQATQFFVAGQQHDFTNAAAVASLKASVDLNFQATQQAIQLSQEKAATASALATAATQMLVVQEAVKGREQATMYVVDALRIECERNKHWEGQFYASQQANVNSALQALNSNLNETRQGVVNFGSMTGNAGRQTSTSNNV